MTTGNGAPNWLSIRQWALILSTIVFPSHALAGYIYVEPKMMGGTSLSNGNGAIFDSVEEAINAKLAEITAARAGMACPPNIYSNPAPVPFERDVNQRIINGIYWGWGLDVAERNTSLPGCQFHPPVWGGRWATLQPICPTDSPYGLKQVGPNEWLAYCAIHFPDEEPCSTCKTTNPVLITRGEKTLSELDYSGPSGLEYKRVFRGKSGRFFTEQGSSLFDLSRMGAQPSCLPANYNRPQQGGSVPDQYCFPYMSIGVQEYGLVDRDGSQLKFTGDPAAPTSSPDIVDKPTRVTDAQGVTTWRVRRSHNVMEVYAASGQMTHKVTHDGRVTTTTYGENVLTQTDSFGRSLRLEYTPLIKTVARMIDPDGSVYEYQYNANLRLSGVTYPADASGTRHTKTYHYESVYYPGTNAIPIHQLTGITDENNHRISTFTYDAQNRVTSTRLHAGGGVDVNQYGLNYSNATRPAVTDPLGTVRTYNRSTIHYRDVIAGISQPAGAGTAAATMSATYDAQRNLASRNDFTGKRTCYANDLGRNLETVRVEGLSAGAACSVTAANATLPAGSRKVSTEWHPDWRLETKVAEPGKLTSLIYNGQPDPFNGNAVASCAPTSALLPDGKPIAVVCKQVEQATTDANGAQGFSVPLQAGVPNRVTAWTYNQHGQVLSEDGPRTDVNDTTTYAYYSDTSFNGEGTAAEGHYMGDLQSITNAAGRVTQYTKYNKHGQVLESIDPNGVVTTNTYDARMRLLSTTTAGQSTSYTYDAAGQLKRVTLPDQSWIGYDYDGAHRQTAVYDHQGNRTEYVLDNAANRIGETTRDPSGALKRQLSRSIDALGRVQEATGRE